jgi:hypothetical protein
LRLKLQTKSAYEIPESTIVRDFIRFAFDFENGGEVGRFDFAAGDVQEMIRNRDALMASVITSDRIARIYNLRLEPALVSSW